MKRISFYYIKKCISGLLLASLALTANGCVDISGRELPGASRNQTIIYSKTEETTTSEPEETAVPELTTTTTTAVTDDTSFSEEYGTFILSDEDKEFISGCVFVGDSICSGLANYGIVPWEQMAAQGNIAARNIFDFTFTDGGAELSLLALLVDRRPDYIVFSMGMNDVNITTKQEFTENYRDLLKTVEGFLPKAKLIVLSITPVTEESTFTSNERIDAFNEELEKSLEDNSKWTYVDITPEMKDPGGALKKNYDGGDGVHLSPDAYYAILGQLCTAVTGE